MGTDRKKPIEALNELVIFSCSSCKDYNKQCNECIVQKNKQIIMEALNDKQNRIRG